MKKLLSLIVLLATPVLAAQPFEVIPSVGATGTIIFLKGAPDTARGVRFNGIEAALVTTTPQGLIATVPQLPNGFYDVSAVSPDGSLVTAKSAFEYRTLFDPRDYARVLFPLVFAGPGAGGSQWTSDNRVVNNAPIPMRTIPNIWLPSGIGTVMPDAIPAGAEAALGTRDRDIGALLLIPRGLEPYADFSSHFRDLSKQAESLGTELRVVFEKDTADVVRIVRIPADARFRPRLRVYDIDGNEQPVTVEIRASGVLLAKSTVTPRRSFVCVTVPCEDAAYASLDFPMSSSVDVIVQGEKGRRLWAFVSITNNATQQVTTYSPQR